MKKADSDLDWRAIVETGYDRCSESYGEARSPDPPRVFDSLVSNLEEGTPVLDIGCGNGVPVCRELAKRFSVTGIDISGEQIHSAERNVPSARFIKGDISKHEFPDRSFQGITCLYTLFHLPRELHEPIIKRIGRWLKPGGIFLVTVTEHAETAYTEELFGAEMFWSNWSRADYDRILRRAGYEILEAGVLGSGFQTNAASEEERHPYFIARLQS